MLSPYSEYVRRTKLEPAIAERVAKVGKVLGGFHPPREGHPEDTWNWPPLETVSPLPDWLADDVTLVLRRDVVLGPGDHPTASLEPNYKVICAGDQMCWCVKTGDWLEKAIDTVLLVRFYRKR